MGNVMFDYNNNFYLGREERLCEYALRKLPVH